MLSYLKEDANTGDSKANKDKSQKVAGEQEQNQQGEYLMPANNSRMAKQGTLILMVLFAVGVGVVFMMVKKVVPSEADAADNSQLLQIETAIAKLAGIKDGMYGQLDQFADKFYKLSNVNQVPADDLVKNPFVHVNKNMSVVVEETPVELNSTVKKELKLWSIMESEQGACSMINNKLLYVGDKIEGMTVSRIGSNYVELTAGDEIVILRMSK